jgi:bacterioferritin-associated ferredoxin
MYVCVCRAVTACELRAAIDRGATTVKTVIERCGAGDDCGACHGVIEDMIDAGMRCLDRPLGTGRAPAA